MIWLYLIVALAFVLGGVLAVRPTKAQARIAEIRERAISSGLHVKLPVSLKLPAGVEKRRTPFYCEHFSSKALENNHYYALRHGNVIGSSEGDIPANKKAQIDDILTSAPKDIDGFYLGNGLLGFSWIESENEAALEALRGLIAIAKSKLQTAP